MKIYINFNDSGFTLSDFKGMRNFETLLLNCLKEQRLVNDNELLIDRQTHSTACEFFEITEIHLKHKGGIT